MPIIYALVARGTTVLCEYATTTGNFDTVTRMVLEKINFSENAKRSLTYNRHVFHYIVENGLMFLCMCDEDMERRIPFAFLSDIVTRWTVTYADRGKSAMAYGMNEDFSKVLRKQMDYFSNDPKADKINKVKGEIDEVKNIMVTNIEKVLERGERIELLVDKTDTLSNNALQFKRKATGLKRAMWWKNCKLWLLIVFLVLVVIFVLTLFICGGFSFHRCRGKKSAAPTNSGTTTTTGTTTTGGNRALVEWF